MRVLVALGGNALLKRGEPMTAEVQRANIHTAARALAPVAEHHQLVREEIEHVREGKHGARSTEQAPSVLTRSEPAHRLERRGT